MRLTLWSFVSGLLWGVGSGIGLMLWVLVKLMRFQRQELERRHAWLRWGLKYRNLRAGSLESVASEWRWEALDQEFKDLLAAVNAEFTLRGEPTMSQPELGAAIRSLLHHREEGNARFAIQQAVGAVQAHRRAAAAAAAAAPGGVPAPAAELSAPPPAALDARGSSSSSPQPPPAGGFARQRAAPAARNAIARGP